MLEIIAAIIAIGAAALIYFSWTKPEPRDPEIEQMEDDFAEEIGSKIEIDPPVGFKVNNQGRLQAESRSRKKDA